MSAPLLSLAQHAHGGGPSGPPPGAPLLPTVALYLVVALAGLLMAPALTGTEAGRWRRTALISSVAVAYGACAAVMALRGSLAPVVAVAALVVTAVAVGCAVRRNAADQLAAGAALLAVQTAAV